MSVESSVIMGKTSELPKGWLDYEKVGKQVPGTRFIAFKVPLKESLCQKRLTEPDWFTPLDVLDTIPKLKLIINLTNTVTGRYYDYSSFTKNGVEVLPLKCEGRGSLPSTQLINRFYVAVDDFLKLHATDSDALIGVHCTHGLNRTGLFICKYMVQRMGIPPPEAIEQFETARGHKMERDQYILSISSAIPEATPAAKTKKEPVEIENWRARPNPTEVPVPSSRSKPSRWTTDDRPSPRWTPRVDLPIPTSRYDRRNNAPNIRDRPRSQPYGSRYNNMPGRNFPPGPSKRPNSGGYSSPLDNCYD